MEPTVAANAETGLTRPRSVPVTRMSEACRDATLRQLTRIHDWHVREKCYAAALARIIDAHRA